jgi:hypothetical protein
VIDAINKMTNFTADGLLPGVNWTLAHQQQDTCYAISKIANGAFKPVFGKPGKPFVCLPSTLAKIPANPEVKG